ncbi:hypothetical protein KBD59_00800 [Candidatus Gracilibacteria bacterium]|nr:hypothetical protein [Candidatus Gracilibacteria bacterium]
MDELLNNQLNQDIILMLALSQFMAQAEKRAWVELLEDMTDEEKNILKNNLQQALDNELVFEKGVAENFVEELASLPV